MFQLNKRQLDSIATTLGIIGGVAGILTTNHILDPNLGGSIAGIAFLFLGVVTNKPPREKLPYLREREY